MEAETTPPAVNPALPGNVNESSVGNENEGENQEPFQREENHRGSHSMTTPNQLRASPEGTAIHITEVPGQGSDVILLQAELTGLAEQSAEAGASSQSPIPDHSQDPQSRAATLQLPVQSPIHRPDSTEAALSLVTVAPNQSPDTSSRGMEESLTDLAPWGEFRGNFTLRPSQNQVILHCLNLNS